MRARRHVLVERARSAGRARPGARRLTPRARARARARASSRTRRRRSRRRPRAVSRAARAVFCPWACRRASPPAGAARCRSARRRYGCACPGTAPARPPRPPRTRTRRTCGVGRPFVSRRTRGPGRGAGATWIVRGRVAATPRAPRGTSAGRATPQTRTGSSVIAHSRAGSSGSSVSKKAVVRAAGRTRAAGPRRRGATRARWPRV